jgi:hypothetical protein
MNTYLPRSERVLDLRQSALAEPLQQIEAALATLAPGGVLQAHTAAAPGALLKRLDLAGWRYALRLLPDGSAMLAIRRPATADRCFEPALAAAPGA